MSKEPTTYTLSSKIYPDTLYICSKRTIIKDNELDIEIDLTDKIKHIDKINIDGIVFVKELSK